LLRSGNQLVTVETTQRKPSWARKLLDRIKAFRFYCAKTVKEISHFLDNEKLDPVDSGRPQMLNNPTAWAHLICGRHESAGLFFKPKISNIFG
jgi:hypothetical protein